MFTIISSFITDLSNEIFYDLYIHSTVYIYDHFVDAVFLRIRYVLNWYLILFKYYLDDDTWPTLFSFFLLNVNVVVVDVQRPFPYLNCNIYEAPCNWNDNSNFLEILIIYLVNVIKVVNYHMLELVFVKPLFDYLYYMVLNVRNCFTYLNHVWNYTRIRYNLFLIHLYHMDMLMDILVFYENFLIN